ncbi:MAG: hypothetical protein ACRECW_09515 [Phyllobacterium sp.]
MRFLSRYIGRSPTPYAQGYRDAMTMLNGMSATDCADIGIKPADFSRIAREMASR